MSLATWKKEFYGPMVKAAGSLDTALEHSLKKWTGLLPKNLEKHKVEVVEWGDLFYKGQYFGIDYDTCAVCQFYKWSNPDDWEDCPRCILAQVRQGRSCCTPTAQFGVSPYDAWIDKTNPKPMIKLLEKALAKVKEEKV